MNILIQEITEHKNLYWAWEKTKWCYKPGDIWFNEIEVAAFEANLDIELASIRKDILSGTYTNTAIQPVPFPKGKNADGPRTRQTFWVSVRDQVTWIAVVNIIGKYLDSAMPFWSYGNRLFVPVFKEEGEKEWKFGSYRNTSRYIFRTWKQSWPMFRRHINITTKFLSRRQAGLELIDLDEIETELLETNKALVNEHPLKVRYLEADYWKIDFDGNLFWASIDFEKFYPSVKHSAIKSNLIR